MQQIVCSVVLFPEGGGWQGPVPSLPIPGPRPRLLHLQVQTQAYNLPFFFGVIWASQNAGHAFRHSSDSLSIAHGSTVNSSLLWLQNTIISTMPAWLSVCLPVSLPVGPSPCLPVCQPVCLPVCVFLSLSLCLSVCLPLNAPECPVCLPDCPVCGARLSLQEMLNQYAREVKQLLRSQVSRIRVTPEWT